MKRQYVKKKKTRLRYDFIIVTKIDFELEFSFFFSYRGIGFIWLRFHFDSTRYTHLFRIFRQCQIAYSLIFIRYPSWEHTCVFACFNRYKTIFYPRRRSVSIFWFWYLSLSLLLYRIAYRVLQSGK